MRPQTRTPKPNAPPSSTMPFMNAMICGIFCPMLISRPEQYAVVFEQSERKAVW
jgi:hypothetical protein